MIKTRFIVAIGLLMTLACCSNSGTDQTPDPNPPTPPTPPATGDYVSVQNGKIYAPNGGELSLWGVNFQPCLSWEYNDRLKRHGIPQTAEALRRVAENNLEEVTKLKVSVIRCHLTPADFTDAEGNLVETPYLDVLDYMVAEAAERGIYITLALINHMGSGYVPNSVFMTAARQEWVHDKEVVRKSKNYVRQLLTRKNNYSGTTYAAEKHIALWELINEPEAFSYTDIQSNPAAYADFQSWAAGNGQQDNDASYALFRQELIRDYIDGMYDVIREAGAQQPVVWSHNWHRYRNGNPDIFKGALASKAEAVEQSQRPHVAGLFGLVQPVFRRREWLRVDDAPRIRRQGEDRLRVRDLLQPKRLSLPHTGAVFPGAGRAVRLNVDVYHAGIRPLPLRFAFPEPHVHAEKSRQLHRGGRNLQIHPAGTNV